MTATVFLTLVLAGALGAVARALLTELVETRWTRQGAGTLMVNLLGAFALGAWLAAAGPVAGPWVAVVGTGFLGAFTTFSTWMVVLLRRWHAGERGGALAEGALTLVAGVLAAAAGAWSVAALLG